MYTKSAILALFLGSSSAIGLNKHHHHHHQAAKNKRFAEGYAIGESMGENLTMNDEFRTVAEEPVVYKFA